MTPELYIGGIAQVRAYRLLQAKVAGVVRSHGLGSVGEWFILNHVYHEKKVVAKDLAALLDVEAPLITRLVSNLAEMNLVQVNPDAKDKRVKFITPTNLTQKLVETIHPEIEKLLDTLLKGISKKQLESYGEVLNAIIANAEER